MRSLGWMVTALVLGCSPHVPEGLACDPDHPCPPGQSCTTGTCHLSVDGTAPIDAFSAVDGGPTETGVDAPSLVDAASIDAGIDATDAGPVMLRFSDVAHVGAAADVTVIRVADLDGSGTDDLVFGTSAGFALALSQGVGFATGVPTFGFANLADLVVTPYDGNASTDVLVVNSMTFRVVLYANDGTAALTPATGVAPTLASVPVRLGVIDVDDDGDPDVALSSPSGTIGVAGPSPHSVGEIFDGAAMRTLPIRVAGGPAMLVMHNTGPELAVIRSGIHWPPVTSFPPGSADLSMPIAVAVGDLDGDGRDDIAYLRGGAVATTLYFFRQSPDGTFTISAPMAMDGSATDVAVADLDGVSGAEVVVTHASTLASGAAQIFDGSTSVLRGTIATGNVARVVAFRLDGDARIDLAMVGTNREIHAWHNDSR